MSFAVSVIILVSVCQHFRSTMRKHRQRTYVELFLGNVQLNLIYCCVSHESTSKTDLGADLYTGRRIPLSSQFSKGNLSDSCTTCRPFFHLEDVLLADCTFSSMPKISFQLLWDVLKWDTCVPYQPAALLRTGRFKLSNSYEYVHVQHTTQMPETVLLARNVHTLFGFAKPAFTRWFFVQLYVGSWTFRIFIKCKPWYKS